MAFKIPKVPFLMKKNHNIQKVYDELPVTLSKDVQIVKEVGSGGFGRVMLCIKEGRKQVILKEMLKCSDRQAKLFVKEAKIIYTFNHRNIVQFDSLYQSDSPDTLAFLMEYVYFDFIHFEQKFKVSSLNELLLQLDKFDCKDFEHLQMVIAKDITRGLSFLHENNVVHRDLKPDNVLISNQHYSNTVEMENAWKMMPIVAKITDFGESRTPIIQTMTLVDTKTSHILRGTAPFLAPEAFTDHDVEFGLTELKNMDIWALLMIFYILINPDKKFPFEEEINKMFYAGWSDSIMIMKQIFKTFSAPKHSEKYHKLRLSQWRIISDIFQTCTSSQRPSSEEILLALEEATYTDRNLKKKDEIPQKNKDLASICKGKDILDESMMSPESNWNKFLTEAPFAIALLEELILISADTDFSLEGKLLSGDNKYLRFSNSFRAAFFHVRSAFNKAHASMDEIFLLSGRIDGHVNNAIRFLFKGIPREVEKMLPLSLTEIQNIPVESLLLAEEIEEHFVFVLNLSGDLLLACTHTNGVYKERSQEIEKGINVAKVQSEHREKEVKESERKLQKRKKKVNTIRGTLVKCIKTLAEFREKCGKLLRCFQMISNYIKCYLHTSLQDFIDHAKAGQHLKMSDLSSIYSPLWGVTFELALRASRIAYVVRAISGAYVQISNKHFMFMITRLERIIARNPPKKEHEITLKVNELHIGCNKTQESIQSIIVEQKAEFNRNIEERIRKIAEMNETLCPVEPKREGKIQKPLFTSDEIDDLI